MVEPNIVQRAPGFRVACYRCFKPEALCLCGAIPRVENRTFVTLLQHPRERFHPFGTARIALQGLARISHEIGIRDGRRCVVVPPALLPRTGLLFPSPTARELTDLGDGERPEHLIVIDGTWSQAQGLYDSNPWLHALPHYRLSPASPSRYRIRRQPDAHCLSTIESIAAALSELEPETPGLEELVAALDELVDRQVSQQPEGGEAAPRFKRPRRRGPRHVASVLAEEPERVVVVHAEAAQCPGERVDDVPRLLQWSAVRPFAARGRGSSDVFQCRIAPRSPQEPGYLACLGFDPETWQHDTDLAGFGEQWRSYLQPRDVLAPWNHKSLRLLEHALGPQDDSRRAAIRLKESYCNVRGGPCGSVLDAAEREGVAFEALGIDGRAGPRLGAAAAIARWLHHDAVRASR